jgi:hypothetical protein
MCTRRQELRKLIESSPDPCGMPIMSAALKRWKLRCPISKQDNAALRRAKVRQERLHDLRHSFASNLLGAGTDIVTVSKALAHADVHIVLTTHAHAITRERQGVGDALSPPGKMETWTAKIGIQIRHNETQAVDAEEYGEVAERLNAPVLKTGVPLPEP